MVDSNLRTVAVKSSDQRCAHQDWSVSLGLPRTVCIGVAHLMFAAVIVFCRGRHSLCWTQGRLLARLAARFPCHGKWRFFHAALQCACFCKMKDGTLKNGSQRLTTRVQRMVVKNSLFAAKFSVSREEGTEAHPLCASLRCLRLSLHEILGFMG